MSRRPLSTRALLRRAGGLRVRVGAGLVAAVAAFAAVVIVSSNAQLGGAYSEMARGEARSVARALDAAFEPSNLARPTELRHGLEALMRANPEILRAAVRAPAGPRSVPLAVVDRADVRLPVPGELSPSPEPAFRQRDVRTGAHVADLIAPLTDRNGERLATLVLRTDLGPQDAVLARRTRNLVLAAVLGAAGTAGLIFALLGHAVARPLAALGAATRDIARGRLATRLGWAREDEVGDLARDLDAMAETLEAGRRRLERSNDALHRARAEQARLRRVAEAVAADADPAAALGEVAEEAAALLDADGGAVARFDADGLTLVASWERPGAEVECATPEGAIATARVRGDPSRVDRRDGPGGAMRTYVAAPIRVEGSDWGAVGVVGGDLPADALDRIERVAGLAALAVARAFARARLLEQASTDALTGLANRRAFQEALASEVARAASGTPLSLALIDLDHFKRINDEHGHQAGDQVLREVARRLRGSMREGDTLARVGGEEFAWLMPGATGVEASLAAERARAAIADAPAPVAGRITVSAGVCELDQAGGADELYRLADGALYWAKRHGRDVVYRQSRDVAGTPGAGAGRRPERGRSLQSLRALAAAVDARNVTTRGHSERVAGLAAGLARELGWSPEGVAALREAALVHDVGYVAVPERVSEGPLGDREAAVARSHTAIGAEMARDALGDEQRSWVRGHHERWDGRGYPDGLRGEDVPEGARILGLADAWDHMIAAGGSPADALRTAREAAGGRFWPPAVEALASAVRDGAPPPPGAVDVNGSAPAPAAGPRRAGG